MLTFVVPKHFEILMLEGNPRVLSGQAFPNLRVYEGALFIMFIIIYRGLACIYRGLACCDSWGCKESDTTEQLI